MIIFSDLHLDNDSAEVCLGQILPGIRHACTEHKDNLVAMLGDFWHLRYRVEVRLLNAVRDQLRSWAEAGIEVLMLPGNHDQVDVGGRNALEVLGEIPHVTVFTEPGHNQYGIWIPYRRDPQEVVAALRREIEQTRAGLPVFLHHGLRGSQDNYGDPDQAGVDVQALPSTVPAVLAGHYHRRQTLPGGRAHYIGSPRQVTAREAGQEKGYAVWDTAKLSLTWVTKAWAPRYHVVQADAQGNVVLPLDLRTDDDVRVMAPEAVCRQVAAQLDSRGLRHTVTPILAESAARLNVGAAATLGQYAQAYAEREGGALDKARLMRVYQQLAAGRSS